MLVVGREDGIFEEVGDLAGRLVEVHLGRVVVVAQWYHAVLEVVRVHVLPDFHNSWIRLRRLQVLPESVALTVQELELGLELADGHHLVADSGAGIFLCVVHGVWVVFIRDVTVIGLEGAWSQASLLLRTSDLLLQHL